MDDHNRQAEPSRRATPRDPLFAIVVAGGRGLRAGGGLPKQYRALGDRPVLTHCLLALAQAAEFDAIIVVIHPDDAALARAALPDLPMPIDLVHGGATRAQSVRAGLMAIAAPSGRVLIHDAARPFVDRALVQGVIGALDQCAGAAPALPVTDALWRGTDAVAEIVPRAGLWRAQTPQGFDLAAIRAAHDSEGAADAADDVEIALKAGIKVAITQGSARNFKLTTAEDFRQARMQMGVAMDIRTGNGFDVHAFGAGDHVMLCGVKIPHERGLVGHSDADVGLHTITDAIYGALAMGDIGTHFPPSDPQWKGAASDIFLKHAADLAREMGFAITHCDLTFLCERPKIGPHAGAMRESLSRIIGIGVDRISVKATTTEKLGFTGREEGIAAMATVTLVKA